MTDAEAEEAILQRWDEVWPTLHPAIPYTFENETYAAIAAWARVTVVPTTRAQKTQGHEGMRRFENQGRIMVQLFGAIDVGTKPLNDLVASVREVYEARRIGGDIVTRAAAAVRESTDGAWAMRMVSIPYDYSQTR